MTHFTSVTAHLGAAARAVAGISARERKQSTIEVERSNRLGDWKKRPMQFFIQMTSLYNLSEKPIFNADPTKDSGWCPADRQRRWHYCHLAARYQATVKYSGLVDHRSVRSLYRWLTNHLLE